MRATATNVQLSDELSATVAQLANRLGTSEARVIEQAVKVLEERLFWNETAAAFDRIAADPAAAAEQRAEIDAWEQGTSRDYDNEK